MHGFSYGGCWSWVGFMLNAVNWVLIISFLIWLGMRMNRGGHSMHERHGAQDALDIAKERYAKGEINHNEFERIKKNLS